MKITFIGGGNMAGALIGGLLARGHRASDLVVVDPSEAARAGLRRHAGIDLRDRAERDAVADATVVVAVKPQQMQTVARGLAPILSGELLISVAAGIRSADLARWLGGHDAFSSRSSYAHCVFEFIYFSRPDSFVFGKNVDRVRRLLGRRLATEHPVEGADIVMGVPDSATTAALGFSEASNVRFDIGLIRNHYVGRTFIHPSQLSRDSGVRIKFNTVKGVLKGKKIVLVDDSIVRGTTMKKIIRLIRTGDPAEIHLRISSPPIICPCFYGIDMPTTQELVAGNKSIEEIRQWLDVDSLAYLSIEGMLSVMPDKPENYCRACFTGDYPIAVPYSARSGTDKTTC